MATAVAARSESLHIPNVPIEEALPCLHAGRHPSTRHNAIPSKSGINVMMMSKCLRRVLLMHVNRLPTHVARKSMIAIANLFIIASYPLGELRIDAIVKPFSYVCATAI